VSIEDSYSEGFDAFERDLDVTDNPYPMDTFKAGMWDRGWIDASEADWAKRSGS
jgi:hypothetical protein